MGAMVGELIRRDRERSGLSLEQAASRLQVPPRRYLKLEAGEIWPDFENLDRIERLFGWRPTRFDHSV
jgi:transcriptional regulator with XRE-family HTH domain